MNASADWLLKLRISFAIHLRAIRAEFAPENVVIFAGSGINEFKSSFYAISHCLQLVTSVSVASGGYLPPLATDTEVTSC